MLRGAIIALSATLYTFLFAFSGPRAQLVDALGPLPACFFGVLIKVLPAALLAAFPSRAHPAGTDYVSHGSRVSTALLLSSVGDLLMDFCEHPQLGGEAAFLGGLGAFLFAHLCYCAGFYTTVARHAPAIAFSVCAPAFLVLKFLAPHILDGAAAPLFPAVCVYVAVISGMLYLAAVRRAQSARGYWLTVAGAALFMLSDTVLAWDKFAPPPKNGAGAVVWWFREPKALVMVTYFGAQALLAAGASAPGEKKEA